MSHFQFQGVKLRFLDEGAGKPILFLHGFPLCAEMWRDQISAFRDGWRCLALDLPGFGVSEPLPEGVQAGIGLYAEAVESLMDRLELPKTAIVALSMGGYVALELIKRAPGRVSALVLADTRATPDSEDAKRAREATARAVEEDGTEILAERMIPNLVSPEASAELRARIEQLIVVNSPEGAAAATRAMGRRVDNTPVLATIACPTLVLTGRYDSLTPPADGVAMAAEIPGGRHELLEGAGHLSNLEAPSAFNAAVRGFLESV